MAAVTSAAIAGAGLLMSGYQMIEASNRRKNAENAINAYQRQELTNPYEGLQVSTMGADVQREELQRSNTEFINQLARGGVRGLIGGLPNLQLGVIQQSRQIGADLDAQFQQNQQLVAGGNLTRMQMQEQREFSDLAALGSERSAAMQDFGQGMNNAFGSLSAGISAYGTLSKATAGLPTTDLPTVEPPTIASKGVILEPNTPKTFGLPMINTQPQYSTGLFPYYHTPKKIN